MPGKSRWFNTTFDSAWTQFGNRLHYTLMLWEVCLYFSTTVIQLLGFKVRLCCSNMSQVVCCECVCETRYERHSESYTSHTSVLSLSVCPPSSLPYQGISVPVSTSRCCCELSIELPAEGSSHVLRLTFWPGPYGPRVNLCVRARVSRSERGIERVH